MEIVQQLDKRLWREFVDSHPIGNVFHTPEMFQVFSGARGHHPNLWDAVGGDGRVFALLLPVQIALMNRLLLPGRAVSAVLCRRTIGPGLQ